jgi:protein Tex
LTQLDHSSTISQELNIQIHQIKAVQDLLSQDATIPFIARYRKEATGSLDETQITAIRDRIHQLAELDQRRETILNSLEKNGHLTDELKEKVLAAESMTELEDIYLPYKPKRRTKGMIAKERGLEPLAQILFEQTGIDPLVSAATFVDPEKEVATEEDALQGARHIMAEWMNEDEAARTRLRALFNAKGIIRSNVIPGKEEEGVKFKDYYEWQEPAHSAPSHRILAMRRGEREDILSLSMQPAEEQAMQILEKLFLKGNGDDSAQVALAIADSYKRLLSRAMETELRLATKDRAEKEAIRVFADNLRQLLLAPPLGAKRVMGIDPGFRTGCKVICLDRQGKLLQNDTIYPHTSKGQVEKAKETIRRLCAAHRIEAVAIGNGTAGRETEAFVRGLELAGDPIVLLVSESGASVYSASEVAREEFPDHDITVRGAVSIGRRLMDPLAELVKIDPKSIGVGQYQHDVDQGDLKAALDDVVISCVNAVGVDVNRASAPLLAYVSGLGPQLARNIVSHRDAHGPFLDRKALKDVSRLGPKAFEQSAGFLRITDAVNPLDGSAVHPESYAIVDNMAADIGSTVAEIMAEETLRQKIDLNHYVTETIGLPTLTDIMKELAKPGRDPRQSFEIFAFDENVSELKDLEPGMRLPGIVTNITKFGAFVDIGVHQDGLVHISEMADRFIKDPAEVVRVQQKVQVTVLEVDIERKRIALSLRTGEKRTRTQNDKAKKSPPGKPRGRNRNQERRGNQPFHNPLAEALSKLKRN